METSTQDPAAARRIRCQPPSAAFDPPSPTLSASSIPAVQDANVPTRPSNDSTLVNTTASRISRRKARDPDSSSDNADSSDDLPDYSGEFTARGQMRKRDKFFRRARRRALRERRQAGQANAAAPEDSGREDGRTKRVINHLKRKASAQPGLAPLMTSLSRSKPSNQSVGSDNILEPPMEILTSSSTRSPVGRRHSDPGSPIVAHTEFRPLAMPQARQTSHPVPRYNTSLAVPSRRVLAAHWSQEPESLTDSEVVRPNGLARPRALGRLHEDHASDAEKPSSGTSTPRLHQRLRSQLKASLPPPMTQRFSYRGGLGWRDVSRGNSSDSHAPGPSTSRSRHAEPTAATDDERPSEVEELTPIKRTKSRRRRLEAQIPPTPSGLGFVPTEREIAGPRQVQNARIPGEGAATWKEGRVVNEEFDWGPREKREAARQKESPGTHSMPNDYANTTIRTKTTKVSEFCGIRIPWRTQLRSNAWIQLVISVCVRLVCLIIAAIDLDQANSSRREQNRLGLPGIIGSSTILGMAIASLTIVHVVGALLFEKDAGPVGLLKSGRKMFAVALEVVILTFWVSTLALSINDLIATPLECVSTVPWWTSGLGRGYHQLVETSTSLAVDLNSGHIDYNGTDYAPIQFVSGTLSVQLPRDIVTSSLARQICHRHEASIALALLLTIMYAGTLLLTLFTIISTSNRAANLARGNIV